MVAGDLAHNVLDDGSRLADEGRRVIVHRDRLRCEGVDSPQHRPRVSKQRLRPFRPSDGIAHALCATHGAMMTDAAVATDVVTSRPGSRLLTFS
jgi:hypothetical protein